MKCEELDKLLATPSVGDKQRLMAIHELIRKCCLKSLYNHAITYSRIQWIRNYALTALTKFANINIQSEEVAIAINEDELIIEKGPDREKLRKEAAKYLFLFITLKDKPLRMKQVALVALINGNHQEFIEELQSDNETPPWVMQFISSSKFRKGKK